jgi:dTDP-4-dehydrorhamnose 3,5-epimerase
MGRKPGPMGTLKTDSQNSPFPEVSTFLFEPHLDFRGTWQRIWDLDSIRAVGHNPEIEQVSISTNPQAHTLRGLHSLKPEASEFKAVICLTGAVQDVLVDVRPNSPTWGTYASFELDAKYLNGVLIPPGFAHGFLTLEAETRLLYLMSVEYDAGLENNFCWNDPEFSIEWLAKPTLISEKDNKTPWISSR